jgi:hypothetical protein
MPRCPPYQPPTNREEVYADYDKDFEIWGVFGLNSGFCYQMCYTEEQAKHIAADRNFLGGAVMHV